MGLSAVKNINCNQTKFVLHQRGRWKLLPWTQVEHMRRGGCVQKYSALFLGLRFGCQGNEVRIKHKEAEQVLERHELIQLEADGVKLISPWCLVAGDTGSEASVLSCNPFYTKLWV